MRPPQWSSLGDILTRRCSYLWPGYSDASSNHHVLLIVLITNAKRRERLQTWGKCEALSKDGDGRVEAVLTVPQASSRSAQMISQPSFGGYSL